MGYALSLKGNNFTIPLFYYNILGGIIMNKETIKAFMDFNKEEKEKREFDINSIKEDEKDESSTILNQEYYKGRKVQDFIELIDANFSIGSAIKYLARYGKKDAETPIKDLTKARNYIQFEIERLQRK